MPEPSLSADTLSMLHDEHSQRLEALEKKTNGLIQTRADHGHQFIVIIDRVKALEKRVAALEQVHTERLDMHVERLLALEEACVLLSAMFHDGDCSEDERPSEPLPNLELD